MLVFFGAQNSSQVYDAWARKEKQENLTDEVEAGGKLHWVGPRSYDRVLIYSHGELVSYNQHHRASEC